MVLSRKNYLAPFIIFLKRPSKTFSLKNLSKKGWRVRRVVVQEQLWAVNVTRHHQTTRYKIIVQIYSVNTFRDVLSSNSPYLFLSNQLSLVVKAGQLGTGQ